MALIECGECGREISDRATACPGCGAPVEALGLNKLSDAMPLEPSPHSIPQPGRAEALPPETESLLEEAERAYSEWLAIPEDSLGDDWYDAWVELGERVNAFVSSAVDSGMDPAAAAADLQRRFPDVAIDEVLDAPCFEAGHSLSDPGGVRPAFCSYCGAGVLADAVVCVKCGRQIAQSNSASAQDGPSGGHAVLGFFFPMVGLILYLVWKDSYPLRARSCGRGAAWGFGLVVASYILYALAMGLLLAGI